MRSLPLLGLLSACTFSTAPPAPAPSPAAPAPQPSAPAPQPAEPRPGDPFSTSPACADDAECGFARCDKKAGRCSFPCVADGDCNPVARCLPSPGNMQILTCTVAPDANL